MVYRKVNIEYKLMSRFLLESHSRKRVMGLKTKGK